MKAVARIAPRAARSADFTYVLEDQVGHLLRRAHQRHGAIFQEFIGSTDLTPLQFAALVKLRNVGEVSQNQLGRLTAMDAATMQGVIKRLIARRLIERRPDPEHRRRLLLRLTPAGETLIDGSIVFGLQVSSRTLAPLTPAERGVFLALLRRLAV
jgi:DNA-binding MarR family transcriptional regulator